MKIINKKTLRKTYINLILNMYKQEVMNMGQKGLDFKHKEVVVVYKLNYNTQEAEAGRSL